MAGMTDEEFNEIFRGVRFCFCTLCNHQPSFGYCYVCSCHNHVLSPDLSAEKMLAAIAHLKGMLRCASN